MGQEHERRDKPPEGQYVLVVDDDDAVREALEAVLEDAGYTVRSAANGRDALQLLRATDWPPAVILLDLMMPVMSGWEFRAEQQRDPALAPIPVVVLSADRDVKAKAATVDAGDYLLKPVDIDLLVATVAVYLAPPA